MKTILKSWLFFSFLAFVLEAVAKPQTIQKLQDGALKNIQELQDGAVEVIDTMEFSGSISLIEGKGERNTSIDEAKAQVKVPISNNMAVLLQADARQALGRNLETSDDDVNDDQDKLKKALGLSVAFDVDVNDTPVMILVGKFDHTNFPLSSLSPNTAEEDMLAVERGATGASFFVTLPRSTFKYIATTVLQGAVLNRSEDRDINDDYFHSDNAGYNVSLSHSFLKYSLGISHTSFSETAGTEENVSVFGSYQFNPNTNLWGRFIRVTDESNARQPESESHAIGLKTKNISVADKQTENIVSWGVNHKLNAIFSIFVRADYTRNKNNWTDSKRTSVGATFSPHLLEEVSFGLEFYNREYENPDIEEETVIRSLFRLNF